MQHDLFKLDQNLDMRSNFKTHSSMLNYIKFDAARQEKGVSERIVVLSSLSRNLLIEKI